MVNDLIDLIVRINLALAAGVIVVLLVRPMARRGFGARVAYSLWLLPVLAAGACFLPPRIERLTLVEPLAPVPSLTSPTLGANTAAWQLPSWIWLALWSAGFLLSVGVILQRQGRFSRALGQLRPRADLGAKVFGAESNAHGPAVIGVLRPIIITPADFDERFSDQERRIVLAHERAHLEQGDPLINAFVVALQCANWFNPFVHIGARALKLDQELAADAAVLATSARRPLAEAILKTQIATAAPLVAAWPPNSLQSLKERIAMLKRTLPSRTQRWLGVSAIAVLTLGVCAAAWAAQPPRVVVSKAPHIARADAAPFIEPPVTDASQLAGAPQDEWYAGYSKSADREDDQSADDEADQGDPADLDDESSDESGTTVLSDEDRQEIANARLSPQERARIRAEVRAAVAQSRVAVAQARAAVHAVQSQAVREAMAESRAAAAEAHAAARVAQAEAVREAVAAAREVNSPEMQAEIRAMAAQAAQMARDTHMTEAQREQMRSDIREHAQHLREMTHRHSCPNEHHDEH